MTHMPEFQFDPKVSLGHIVQLLALIIGLTAGYYQIKSDVADAKAIADRTSLKLSGKIDMNTMRITSLQTSIEDKLRFIAENIRDIKQNK